MPNQVESYQKVIDIIADPCFVDTAKAILLQIAKTNPQTVVDAAESINNTTPKISAAVVDYLLGGRKIQAIKQYRTETGAGLKDANDAVEAIINSDGRFWALRPSERYS